MDNKHFRIIFEIGANKEDNTGTIMDWLKELLKEDIIDVDSVSVTEITELLKKEGFKCPLMED